MIQITKDEKMVLIEKLPNLHVTRTCKQDSKRHHYYCEESKAVMYILSKLRGEWKDTDKKKSLHKKRW